MTKGRQSCPAYTSHQKNWPGAAAVRLLAAVEIGEEAAGKRSRMILAVVDRDGVRAYQDKSKGDIKMKKCLGTDTALLLMMIFIGGCEKRNARKISAVITESIARKVI